MVLPRGAFVGVDPAPAFSEMGPAALHLCCAPGYRRGSGGKEASGRGDALVLFSFRWEARSRVPCKME